MDFRTPITIDTAPFRISPEDQLFFVGSCFAQNMGQRMADDQFRTVVNPYGVMYNPASILHTLERYLQPFARVSDTKDKKTIPDVVVLTLGTNHVYILKETGEIVDNCQKRPQKFFRENELTVDHCANYLRCCVELLKKYNPKVRIIFTVSPIRYAKYGFHGSQLSKATLLLSIDQTLSSFSKSEKSFLHYFPSYEIVNDELRDYRFYAPDMLHPSEQAVDYIYERFADTYFSSKARQFVDEWQPIRQALSHKPFHPESAEYQKFLLDTHEKLKAFRAKYHL